MNEISISLLIAAIGCIVGVLGFARASSKDDSELASSIAALQTSLDHIKAQIDELKADLRHHATENASKAQRALDEAIRANARIDSLEKKLSG